MKLINKTRNLALTALVGAALAMGTPAALARTANDNVRPATDDRLSGDFEGDLSLIQHWLEFVKAQQEHYKNSNPQVYQKVLAPQFEDAVRTLEDKLVAIGQANKAALEGGLSYVSPLSSYFVEEFKQTLNNISADDVYEQVAQAQDLVEQIGTELLQKVSDLRTLFEEKIVPELGDAGESFFLNEEESDKILAETDAMRLKIFQAADAAEKVNFEKFDSPVTEAWLQKMAQWLQDFYDTGERRISTTVANLQLHDQNVDLVIQLENTANQTLQEVLEHAKAILGDEIEFTSEEEEFFMDEPDYDKVLAAIDQFRNAMVQAATEAEQDYWQSYGEKVGQGVQEVEKALQQYKEAAKALADNAQQSILRHNKDLENLQELDELLAQAEQAITDKYNSSLGRDMELGEDELALITNHGAYDQIKAQLDELRQAVEAQAQEAEQNHWQSYSQDATGVDKSTAELKREINTYKRTGVNRVNLALASIARHDADVSTLISIENKLMDALVRAQDQYKDKLKDEFGATSWDVEAFFYNEEGFYAIQKVVDDTRKTMVENYTVSLANGLESYDSPINQAWKDAVAAQLQAYADECQKRIDTAVENLQLHDRSIEMIASAETSLAQAFQAVAENINSTLGSDWLNDSNEAFFTGEDTYNQIASQIDTLRQDAVAAYDKAMADYWQSYPSNVSEGAASLDEAIQKYQADTEALADKAQSNIQKHDQDIEYINALESLLAQAAQAISDKYNDTIGDEFQFDDKEVAYIINEAGFDLIQSKIEALRKTVVANATEAEQNYWQSYSDNTIELEEDIAELQQAIADYEEMAVDRIDNALDATSQHDVDVEQLASLENRLMQALAGVHGLYADKLEAELGEPTPEAEAFFYDEAGFNALQNMVEQLREAIAQAYEASSAGGHHPYQSPLTEQWVADFEAKVQAYSTLCLSRVNLALENLQLHDKNLAMISSVESSLVDAFQAIVENINTKLGQDWLNDGNEAFFTGEATYDEIASEIDALRLQAIEAYDKAASDFWQSYPSNDSEGVAALQEAVQKYQQDTEALADNAQANILKHDQDVENINSLEQLLAQAAQAISDKFNSKVGEDSGLSDEEIAIITNEAAFDQLQAQIEELRKAVVAQATEAEKSNWQSYSQEATGVSQATSGLEGEISTYQRTGVNRVSLAMASMARHDSDISTLISVENKLMSAVQKAQGLYADKLEAELGEPTEQAEAFFFNEAGFDAVQKMVDEARRATVEAYEASLENGLESYDSPVTQAWKDAVEAQLQDYADVCESRVNNALANLQLHDQALEKISAVESSLAAAFQAVVENINAKLGQDWLNDGNEAFFTGEATYDKIASEIDALRLQTVQVYDKAAADFWQSYPSNVSEGITALAQAIQLYQDDTEYLANNAQANLQLHDKDVDYIDALESLLAQAAQTIIDKYSAAAAAGEADFSEQEIAFITNEAAFDQIQAKIEALRKAVVAQATEAEQNNWQSYSQEATRLEEAIPELQQAINDYQHTGLNRIDLAFKATSQHDLDIQRLASAEKELMDALETAQDLYANKLQDELGEPSEEAEAFFYDEEGFNALQKMLDQLRGAIVEAYDASMTQGQESYKSPITQQWTQNFEASLQAYTHQCELRVNTALANLQLHDKAIEMICAAEGSLNAAFQAIVENVNAKLGEDWLNDSNEAFFTGEGTYDQIASEIDALRLQSIEAYDQAAADLWQTYPSNLGEGLAAVDQAIQKYQDDTEYLANNAQANLQLHDQDVEYINALEGLLAQAAQAIIDKYNATVGQDVELDDDEIALITNEAVFDQIQAKIEALRMAVVTEATEAEQNNWQSYSQTSTGLEEAIPELQQAIADYQHTGVNRVDLALATMAEHEADILTLASVENKLMAAVGQAQALYGDILEPELGEPTEEAEAFFFDEAGFDAVQKMVDDARRAMFDAYDASLAGGLETYESPLTQQWTSAVEAQLQEYIDTTEYRINNALSQLQLHGEDADMVFELEKALMEAFGEVAAEADDNIDADILEGIRDFLVVEGYEKVLEQIEALRAAMVEQYGVAEADNWQNYEPQVVPEASAVDQAIAQYKQQSQERVLNALRSIDAHQYDLDVLLPLDEIMGDSLAELMEAHPELFEDGSEFVAQYEQLSAQIETLWNQIRQAADAAEADNWQSYKSVFENVDIQGLYASVENFFANAWGDIASLNLHQWETDNQAVISLETMLMAAIQSIQQTNPDYDVDPEFDAIQAAIDALRHKMADAYEEADALAWDTYECPYTQSELEEVEQMINTMVENAQSTSSIQSVNSDDEQPMIFSIDGKRLNTPIPGELNIFVYKNRVEKKIVK